MSLDDLVIKKHTAPLRREIDRLREVKAKLKDQNDALAAALEAIAVPGIGALVRQDIAETALLKFRGES